MDSAAIEKSPTRKRNRLQSTALSLLSFRGFFLTSVDVSNSGKPLLLSRERKNKRRMMGNTVRNGNRELFHPFSSFLLTTLHHLADYDALHFSCAAFPNAAARQCTTEILKQEYLTKLIPIEDWGNIENKKGERCFDRAMTRPNNAPPVSNMGTWAWSPSLDLLYDPSADWGGTNGLNPNEPF
ncbi:hypothetical protein Csa_001201 [Cucumis sativus]|nr:hypothetical protein Csa_001201 [Cucumis sativus]